MSAAPFSMADAAAPGSAGLWQAVARRYNARTLAAGTLIVAALVIVGGMGLVGPVWDAPLRTQLTRLTETAVTGIVIFIAVLAADELTERGAPRGTTYVVAVVAAALIGSVLGWHVRTALGLSFAGPSKGGTPGPMLNTAHRLAHHLGIAIVGSLVGGLAAFVHVSRRTALAARRRQQEAERARAQARRRTLESQLQALQARVEPMFLFDTLKRIRETYRTDVAAGGSMLEDLIVYLRAALPHLRESTSTVLQELRLVRAWLDIVGRGAQRWTVDLAHSEAARDARVPALVLLPLVQCAVADAGTAPMALLLHVRAEGKRLHVAVSTSTDAFRLDIAAQPRLQQIDDRLRALYGPEAAFTCAGPVTGTGSRAFIEMPFEAGDTAEETP